MTPTSAVKEENKCMPGSSPGAGSREGGSNVYTSHKRHDDDDDDNDDDDDSDDWGGLLFLVERGGKLFWDIYRACCVASR